jgi:prepilin-type processing-associated H-X9-DG protein
MPIARADGAPKGCDDLRNGALWSPAGTCGAWATGAECNLVGARLGATQCGAMNGIVGMRSQTTLKEVTDGTSNTLMAGEKFLAPQYYEAGIGPNANGAGGNPGDNSAMYQGYDWDTIRFSGQGPEQDNDSGNSQDEQRAFGSAHTSGFNVVYVDGSVHDFNFDVDRQLFSELGNRNNGG